jgi:hypothetical protein
MMIDYNIRLLYFWATRLSRQKVNLVAITRHYKNTLAFSKLQEVPCGLENERKEGGCHQRQELASTHAT